MKKLRKPRLVLLVFLLTLLVGTISFGAIGLLSTISEATVEPIVFRFNSQEAVDSLLVRGEDNQKVSLYHNNEEKKTGFTETTSNNNPYVHVMDTVNKVNTHVPTIKLDDYPYVLISWKRENATSDQGRFYYNNGSGFKNLVFRGSTDKGWTTTLLDINNGVFLHYDASGTAFWKEAFLSSSSGGSTTWTGNATQLRLDFTYGITTSRTITVEYIGLFPDEASALAYSGAMPNDDAANAIETELGNEMNVSYAQVNTEETATTYVQSKLSQDVADYCTENYPDLANRVETQITDYDVTPEAGGTISVKATMYLGEVLFQTRKEMDITIHVDAKPAPVAVVFNTSAKVEEATFTCEDTNVTLTKTFVDDTDDNGRKYMHLGIESTGYIGGTNFRKFLQLANAAETFSFDDYPYMKISYRRNVPSTMTDELMYFFVIPENAKGYTQSASFDLYKVGEGETPYWQEMVADMRGNQATLITEKDGEKVESPLEFTNGITWKGDISRELEGGNISLRFDFTRAGGAGTREIDIEYIAFFATQEEADNYNPALAEVDTLRANSSATWDNSVTTKELAIAKAEEYINSFGFATVSEIKEGTFKAPTTQEKGSYIFEVEFTDGSVVTVTITIEKLIEPIVYTLDNSDILGKFTIHPYSTMSLENGFMKMITKDEHKSVADSFYVEASYPTVGESFEVDNRKYFKARYRLSGISEAATAVPLQVFYWLDDGSNTSIYSRTITVNGAGTNGNIIELIMDMSVADKTTDAVWIKNVTENGDYVAYKYSDWSGGACTGTITKFRFNPARMANLKRDADVEYIGFFNKLEEAKAYSGAAEERLDEYQQLLESLELNLEWGNGNTREKAIAGAKALIEKKIGCNITIQNYLAPTAKAEGRITFSAEVVSGGVKRTVKDLSATIDKEPTPFAWRFNNLDMINSLTFNPNTKATLKDYAMKMEYENGNSGSEFQFIVETPDDKPQFDLQNYPYIMVKYKRNGIGPVLINYKTDTYNGSFTEIARYGFGTKENSWYTSIVDTTVKNHEQPLVWNFNHDDSRWNWNYYLPINQKIMETDNFQGLSKNFTFTFKTMGQPQADVYIEYIAFFPTMKAALEYKDLAEIESLKANVETALKDYTGTTVASFYDGNTDAVARKKAQRMIQKELGEKLAENVKVTIEDVSYTAPEKNKIEGSYKFKANILTKDETSVLYTTTDCTLKIPAELPEQRVYMFTNPDFIEKIQGSTPTANNYTSMKLSGTTPYYEYQLDETQNNINLDGYKCVVIDTVSAEGPVKLTLNRQYEFVVNDIETVENVSFVFDTTYNRYEVYQGTTQLTAKNFDGLSDIVNETIHTVRVEFGGENAEVRYMGFFPGKVESESFDVTALPTELNGLTDITDATCHYSDSKTEEDAENIAKKILQDSLSDGVQVVDVACTDFTASTAENAGQFICEVLLGYGDITATYYKTVSVTVSIATMPDEPIQIDFDADMLNNTAKVNLSASIENGVLHTETSAGKEDAYIQFTLANAGIDSFYLPDYPYMSIKLKRTGYSGTNTGKSYVYFWNDEYKGDPYVTCPFGSVEDDGEWVVLTFDMTKGTYNLFNVGSEETTNSNVDADSTLNGWIGNLERFRITTARSITVERTADIEYIRFFPTAEMAEEYRGIYFDKFHSFGGYEYAKTTEELTNAPLTFETVIRSLNSGSSMTLISNQQSDTDTNYFALKTTAAGEVELTYCGQVIATTSGADVYSGEWKHITAVVNGDQATIYLNGIEKGTGTISGIDTSQVSRDALFVGGDYNQTNLFVGDMANMELYSVAKTVTDIKISDYKTPKNPADENMVACWSFDKCSEPGVYADASKEDGTNALTLVDQLQKAGHEFTGSDYITTNATLAKVPKTFEAWVKIGKEQLNGTYTLLSNQTASSTNHFSIQLVNGQVEAVYNGETVLTTTDLNIVPGKWTHLAVSFDTIARLYMDGVLKCEGTAAVNTDGISCEKVYIGASPAGNNKQFVGRMSDVRIWNTVRSADEIAAMKMLYPAADVEGLVSAWKLEAQKYLAYEDITSNKNTATLYSDGWYKLENIEYDYTMIHYADTQNLIGYGQEDIYYETMSWVANNKDKMNIVYLSHLGDVTQNNTIKEWEIAKKGFNMIQGIVPYNISLGNHDYPSPSHGVGAEFRDETNFKTYFTYDWYMNGYTDASLGGAFEEDNPVNVYKCINVGNIEYIMFALEFGPRDEVLKWVSDVLKANPNKKAIISTHSYLTREGKLSTFDVQRYGGDFKDGNEGISIWNKLVRKNENIVLVNCGHVMGTRSRQNERTNDANGKVIEIMADPSSIAPFPDDNGLIMIYAFTNEGTMHTYYYSPYKDMYYGTINECTYDMSTALGIASK